MGQVLSLRLPDRPAAWLKSYARRVGRKPEEAARLLLEETLRTIESPHIEFRDSAAGRQAYVRGRRLPVWMVAMTAEDHRRNIEKTARRLDCPAEAIQVALNYARAFPEEIAAALEEHRTATFEQLQRTLPAIERNTVAAVRPRKRVRA